MNLLLNLMNKLITVLAAPVVSATLYQILLFVIPAAIFLLFVLILKKVYKKKKQIGSKAYFVSFLINYNLWFLLLVIFYLVYVKKTEHVVRNTLILNQRFIILALVVTTLLDFSILVSWFAAPAKLNPNSWQWLWSIRESAIQSKYEREREKKMKEYREQMKQRQSGGAGGADKGAKQSASGAKDKKKGKHIDDILYRYLGLEVNCTEDEVKTAYRSLAKKYHPDTSTLENAVEMFMKIQKAYEVLGNKDKRALYDKTGKY